MPYDKTVVNANCVIFQKITTYEYTETEIIETVSGYVNITATHTRTKKVINYVESNAGTTTVTDKGVTTVYDDPLGTIYAATAAMSDTISDFDSVPLNQERRYQILKTETTVRSFL